MPEVEQPQGQRRDGLHNAPLVFQQRARAARHEGARGDGGVHAEFVADVHARAADAHAIVEEAVAEHHFERSDTKHAHELFPRGFECNAASSCSETETRWKL